jgi:hypothetical protein
MQHFKVETSFRKFTETKNDTKCVINDFWFPEVQIIYQFLRSEAGKVVRRLIIMYVTGMYVCLYVFMYYVCV